MLSEVIVDSTTREATRTRSREVRAGPISRWLYFWAEPMFNLASKRQLKASDLWQLPPGDEAEHLTEKWAAAWTLAEERLRAAQEIAAATPLDKKAREAVFTAAVRSFLGPGFFVAAPLVKLVNSTLQFTFPVLLSGTIAFIEGSAPFGALPLTPAVGFALAAALGLMQAIKAVTENAYFFLVMRAGWQLRAAVTTAVYSKSLRLSASSRQQRTLGEMVNLMQVDATKLEMFCQQYHVLWDGLYQIVGYLAMLVAFIGWPTFLGLVVMVVSMPVQLRIMKASGRMEAKVSKVADKRVKSVNEALQSMASVKMYAWEAKMSAAIGRHRVAELGLRRQLARLLSFARAYMMATPLLVSVVAFVAYALANPGEIRASTLFAALTAFGQLRFPLMFYPMALNGLAQFRVSRTRVASLLAMPESAAGAGAAARAAAPRAAPDPPVATGEVVINGGEFWWAAPPAHAEPASPSLKPTGGAAAKKSGAAKPAAVAPAAADEPAAPHRPTLRGVDVHVTQGELIAVVGATGAGKSSLLSAVLGEMVQAAGAPVRVGGSVAYAAQSAWILNATVRENVLFGAAHDRERYARVIAACQLEADLAALPDKDETEIGERGINLSGGQKQRLALARAAYAGRDIVILDDVLSALDPEVASAVFTNCILGELGGSTRVLVTNRLDLVPRCDRVVLIEADADGVGTPTLCGTHDELLARGGAYAALVADAALPEVSKAEEAGAAAAAEANSAAAAAAEGAAQNGAAGAAAAPKERAVGERTKTLITQEERAKGAVTASVYAEYIRRGGGFGVFGVVLLLHLTSTALMTGSTLWVGFWTADARPTLVHGAAGNVTAATIEEDGATLMAVNASVVRVAPPYSVLPFWAYIAVYVGLGLILALMTFVRTVCMAHFCLRASRRLHEDLVGSVMRAPLSFFDVTPTGRIVSRFSKDMHSIDQEVLEFADFFLFMIASLAFTLVAVLAATPWFAVATLPILVVYLRQVHRYRQVSRECKRLESVARSPVFAHFSETLGGIPTIRAYGAHRRFAAANLRLVDALNEAYYLNKVSDRWLSVRLELIGAAIIWCAACLAVLTAYLQQEADEPIDAVYVGLAGTSLVSACGITGILNFVMRAFGQLEAAMTCAARNSARFGAIRRHAPLPPGDASTLSDICSRHRATMPPVQRSEGGMSPLCVRHSAPFFADAPSSSPGAGVPSGCSTTSGGSRTRPPPPRRRRRRPSGRTRGRSSCAISRCGTAATRRSCSRGSASRSTAGSASASAGGRARASRRSCSRSSASSSRSLRRAPARRRRL